MERDEVVVIRRSRGRAALVLAVTLPFTVLLAWILAQGTPGAVLFGGIGTAFFLFATVAVARDLVRPHDLLRIGPDGVDQRATSPRCFIPWSEITGVSVIDRGHRVKAIGITVRDPTVLPRAPLPIRAARTVWGGRVTKAVLVATEILYSGPGATPDALGRLGDDLAPHATFEFPATILTMRVDDLANLLRERREAALRTASTRPEAEEPPPGTA